MVVQRYFYMINQLNVARFIGPRHNSPRLAIYVYNKRMFMKAPKSHRIDEAVNHVTRKYCWKTVFGLRKLVRNVFFIFFRRVEANARQTRGARQQLFLLRVTRHSRSTRACLALVRASETSGTWSEICAVSLYSVI